jgi:hypothetical protein
MRQSLDESGQKAPILGFCQIKFLKKLADVKCQSWVKMEDKLIYREPGKRYISEQAMKELETFKELVEANGANFKIIS